MRERLEVETASAHHEGANTPGGQFLDRLPGQGGEADGVAVLAQREHPEEVVGNSKSLLGRGGRTQDLEAPVELKGIGVDDGGVSEPFGEGQGDRALSGRRRAGEVKGGIGGRGSGHANGRGVEKPMPEDSAGVRTFSEQRERDGVSAVPSQSSRVRRTALQAAAPSSEEESDPSSGPSPLAPVTRSRRPMKS